MIKRLWIAILCLAVVACTQQCGTGPVTPVNPDAGGTAATGGQSSSGGLESTGGTTAVGGESSTGGATVRFPGCTSMARKVDPAQREEWRKTLRPRRAPRSMSATPPNSAATPLSSVFHRSNRSWPLTQRIGSCTGNAMIGCGSTYPFRLVFQTPELGEAAAESVYSWATGHDPFNGTWPPDDTGSNGQSACQGLIALGYATSCISMSSVLEAEQRLQTQPITMGIYWRSTMYQTDGCGLLTVGGSIDGGHQVNVVGLDVDKGWLWGENSWGNAFGVCLENHCGYFAISLKDLGGTKLAPDFDAPLYEPPANDNSMRWAM